MKSYKLSRRPDDWVIIGVWLCKYSPGAKLCPCCQPKHVVPPQVLKGPSKDFRDFFRQTDSTGKSTTPRGSRYLDRRYEPRNFKT